MIELWRQVTRERSGWFWFAGFLRNGDIYHICSLAAPFLKYHGNSHPLYLIVAKSYQAEIAGIFKDSFEDIIVDDRFPYDGRSWDMFFAETSLPRFGLNTAILTHPYYYAWGQPATELCIRTRRSWMDLYKKILELPSDVEPSFAEVEPSKRAHAADLCADAGMLKGRSVILFPYAQSLAVSAKAHFERLTLDLLDEGYCVYTSISGAEEPIAGTQGIFIPFDLLVEVADFCGWIVAVRSGICDIVSSATCRKTIVYPDLRILLTWSVGLMDLARDAFEAVFSFHGSPQQFSELVRKGVDLSPLATPPRRITSLLGRTDAASVCSMSFFEQNETAFARRLAECEAGASAALVVFDIPSRNHERWLNRLMAMMAALARSDVRVFACRDNLLDLAIEEVSGYSLRHLHFSDAAAWHSLMIVSNRSSGGAVELLPSYLHSFLGFPAQKFEQGTALTIGSYFGRGENNDAVARGKPLQIGGLQFLAGWSQLESWGVWSDILRPVLKVFVDRRIGPRTILEIEARGCVSEAFPRLSVTVSANGSKIRDWVIASFSGNTMQADIGEVCSGDDVVVLEFAIAETKSPMDQGGSSDRRKLGIGLTRVCVKEAADR